MAKDTDLPPSDPAITALRAELAAERAKREEMASQLTEAVSLVRELKTEVQVRRSIVDENLTIARERLDNARRAKERSMERIAKQSASRNQGEFGWRISVRGHKQPITMWCDANDQMGAIAVFNHRYGTQFNGRAMTITPIGQPVSRPSEPALARSPIPRSAVSGVVS